MKTVLFIAGILAMLLVWPMTCACAQEAGAQPTEEPTVQPTDTTADTDADALAVIDMLPKVVAEVNGKPIPRDKLVALAVGVYGRQALESLISQELIRQEAARQKVEVSQEEIKAYVDLRVQEQLQALANRAGFRNVEDLARLMEGKGPSLEVLRKEAQEAFQPFAKSELLMRKLIEKSISISDQQIRNAFDMQFGAKAEFLQIVVNSREEAEGVLKKLEMGADFGQLAQSVSVDPASRNRGGAVPPQPENSPLGKPAFALRPGEVSEIIPLGDRFHIVKLVSLIPANDKVKFDDVKDALRRQLMEQALAQGQQEWLAKQFKEAEIQRNL